MKSREICVWLDERWYDALSRHLKDETVEDKLGDYLDQLINELVPEQEYSRISQELWQEDRQARQELEAARKFAIFRIRESGQDRCLQVERPLEFLDAARLLRSYLRGERGASSFEQMLHQAEEITPEAFEDMVLVRMENTGKVTGTFELDFDKREFSAVNVMMAGRPLPWGTSLKRSIRRTARRTSTVTSDGYGSWTRWTAGRSPRRSSLRAGGPDGGGDFRGGRPPEFLPGDVL